MSQPKKVAEIREAFLGFFETKEHLRLPSDSLIPSNDPTLLFTGAGMNQFKDEFLGRGRDMKRATTSQKCLRVPDLENVGVTPRHHTFFEMLGNFSFGDYFKEETIQWEWHFFTEILGWDAERFCVTVYSDDDEAYDFWMNGIGIKQERIYRFGEKENFWPSSAPSKGPNGVCGPCSEIYWDQDPSRPLPANKGLEDLPGRFLEVGNFVFTQFERGDGGVLAPLPQKNIDVGLGLERIAAVAQNVPNNFETDLFAPILAAIEESSEKAYKTNGADGIRMRRIADHCRAVFFCIADGAMPGREGRGYVVRKILRRAVRDGIELGIGHAFLANLLPAVQESMGEAYPELRAQGDTIQAMVTGEESRFRDVYERGIARLEADIDEQKMKGTKVFPGDLAFELHDTYGFPLDTSSVIVAEHGLDLDQAGFDAAMAAQKERARSGSGISADVFAESLPSRLRSAGATPTEFEGYENSSIDSEVCGLVANDQVVEQLSAGQEASIALTKTVLYAEGGGQVGDRGALLVDGKVVFTVTDTTSEEGITLHHGVAKAELNTGMQVEARYDQQARRATESHHSATHLLHAAMKKVVGDHVNQAGSKVSPEGLRFDYTHPEQLGADVLQQIEQLLNEEIQKATAVDWRLSSLEDAKAEGVTALFGEKYGSEVRIVDVPGFSKELCGGCHVQNTGSIGPFRIIGDRALAAGVRRIEAVTGVAAWQTFRQDSARLQALELELKAPVDRLLDRVQALKLQLKEAKERKVVAGPSADSLLSELQKDTNNLIAWKHLEQLEAASLRQISDDLKGKDLPPVVLLTGGDASVVPYLFLCQKDSGFKAGDLAKSFGRLVGGGGGGRPDFAQGKGKKGAALAEAVAEFQKSLATSP
ncbi:MAG: alanine--tRNA ligase [Planctomycetota bacterium]|jgi:alanyl-tRNA synthetase|nr:alanine--tRNA ligase [Planctomycetota bacterium]